MSAAAAPQSALSAPAADQARVFRTILRAMAEPGVARSVPAAPAYDAPPEPLSRAALATLGVLADADAPYWLSSSRAQNDIRRRAAYATGQSPTSRPEAAEFICGPWDDVAAEARDAIRIGTAENPHLATTLVLEVRAFDADAEAPRSVTGPGAPVARVIAASGLDDAFWEWRAELNAGFPLGVDILLTAGAQIVGLPRSARTGPA